MAEEEEEEVARELWKVRRVLQPPSALGLLRGTRSSSVAASLSSFLKCLASLELKTGEGNLRLLLLLAGCVCEGAAAAVALAERRVRTMEPFWAT